MTTSNVHIPSAPSTINSAVLAYLASAVIPMVWGAIELFSGSQPPVPGVPPELNSMLVNLSLGISVVSVLVYVWLSLKLRAGRNWARIVLAVFVVLQLLALFGPVGAASYVGTGLAAVGLVLSFLPDSNRYVVDVQAPR
ncbi:hypothetical protein BJ969_000808 [Saccharopolyspora gloriosae]|uniref:Uncharacterized protein n=1 Tax=Saccharopolyspora gloriosae TaxID=455344 RepID=A0A840N6X2_9PSEU|nr:hypothetical protein [Saccharopolyspora gloriosae]MBB5067720.1 hypothetical protein [Saccharopolyspora gloriosae]